MKYVADTHTHTIASGHAYSTLSEMAKAAAERGLEAVAVTEHGPLLPGSCDPMYFRNYKAIDRHIFGVELLLGSEVDIVGYDGELDLGEKDLKRLDIVLASIHTMCYSIGSRAENTRAYCRALENPYVDIIGHADDGRMPVDYDELARQAKACNKLLELNNSSLLPTCSRENGYENMKLILKYCEKHGTYVTLGSDAHFFDRVGRFEEVQALMDETRFPEELIVSVSLEKLKRHLHKFR